jgi:hypothetical protein
MHLHKNLAKNKNRPGDYRKPVFTLRQTGVRRRKPARINGYWLFIAAPRSNYALPLGHKRQIATFQYR